MCSHGSDQFPIVRCIVLLSDYNIMMARLIVLALSIAFTHAIAWPQRASKPRGPKVPCFFIFGDSLVDNGNNNGMLTLARANYLPYGVDLLQGTTGRFTNGRTYVDVLAQLLGFQDYIPAYATTSGPIVLRGLNYASGGAGIRGETGNNLGGHTPMDQQVTNFARTVMEMSAFFRGDRRALDQYLSKCIFYSGMGSNDYLNNYYMPFYYSTGSTFTPQAYATALLRDYSRQLKRLYELGARKIAVTGVGQIGCIPYELARYNGGHSRCNESINGAILLFNAGLRKLVRQFNKGELPGATFVYLDAFETGKALMANAKHYGLTEIDKGCCGVGKNNGQVTCLPLQQTCSQHKKYFFWDAFHPTEAANIILANLSFGSISKTHAYPINIEQLAKL